VNRHPLFLQHRRTSEVQNAVVAALLLEVGTGLKVPEVWAEGLFFGCFYLPSEKLSKTQNSPVDPAKKGRVERGNCRW